MLINYRAKTAKLTITITLIFLLISSICMYYGSKYITNRLLLSNEHYATDIALIVANNFKITDQEVAYMKTLTFNQMEVDPINMRLMNIGNDVKLNGEVSNVYLVSALAAHEIKYTTDEKTSSFFGYPLNTKLNGIWLLNGKIVNGKFQVAEREDIYRYTKLTPLQEKGLKEKTAIGEYSSDAWGEFITGYAPVFTQEGNFVGLLGIDIAPDKYQANAQYMIYSLLGSFSVIALTMCFLFLFFYYKYIKTKESEIYFKFYSNMSHDLRTPMNGILGTAELAKQENDPATLHNYFSLVQESGEYMLALINDSLDLQKLDNKKFKLTPNAHSLQKVLTSVLDMAQSAAQKSELTLIDQTLPSALKHIVLIDLARFQQILLNLLFNAIKFTPKGGTVTFCAEMLGQVKDRLKFKFKFTIADTGIGMKSSFIKNKLFRPFEQELRLTTGSPSSGLGLSIVHNLLELMEGKIEVTSELNKGTTFTIFVEFPLAPPHLPTAPTKEVPLNTEVLSGKNILLCEDQTINIEVTSKLLAKEGCHVTVAHNGKEALETFASSKIGEFAAILMDMRMPIMDGLTATKAIRSLHRQDASTVPIIAVSANSYEQDITLAKKQGASAYVQKPLRPKELYRVIINQMH